MSTSRKSNGSLTRRKRIDRPFDAAVLSRARSVVADYRIILEPDETLGYLGSAIEMPMVFADGRTPDQCVKAVREALSVAVATMLEMGKRPPVARGQRTQQVNVRLSPDEKLALEEAASQMGFKGLSDYVRAAALHRVTA